MTDDQDTLEKTISRLRRMERDEIEMVEEYLDELEASRGVHILSEEELAILEPAMARARAGEFASPEEVERVFRPRK
jgi:hypothetical protein